MRTNHREPSPRVTLAGHPVGVGHPCFVIAEAGVNHDGDLQRAHALVDVAADAGADAVKFQTFRTDRLVTASAPKAAYQREATGAHESQAVMLRRLELSPEAHVELQRHCEDRGILFLSTPFDEESLELLVGLGVPAIKVGSGEVTNHPFLRRVARTGLPVLLSTGMSTLGEAEAAVQVIRGAGTTDLALFHCVSSYPAPPEETNLRAMETLAVAFGVPVGLSDHTQGTAVSLAAVALGASLLEKHFTLDRTLPGPDHRASLEPAELVALVQGARTIEVALGHGRKEPVPAELDTRLVARRSLVLAADASAGAEVTEAMLTALRPATGISPADERLVLGRRLRRAVRAGELLQWDHLL
ncbi:MAG: sialic acid synthase [Myxococcales bacterium]